MNEQNGSFRNKKVYFSQVSNSALRDNLLSLKAKGLYSLIQSYITLENFTLYKNKLHKECYEGNKAFESAWKELKDKGYLVQYKMKTTEGTFYYEYELLDISSLTEEERNQIPKKGGMDKNKNHIPKKEVVENVPSGKRGIYNNTNPINTDLNNTNLVVVEAYSNSINHKLTKAEKYHLTALCNSYTNDLILKAIDMTVEQANNVNIKYIRTILESFKAKGLNTLQEVESHQENDKKAVKKGIENKRYKLKNTSEPKSNNSWYNHEADTSQYTEYIRQLEAKQKEEIYE